MRFDRLSRSVRHFTGQSAAARRRHDGSSTRSDAQLSWKTIIIIIILLCRPRQPCTARRNAIHGVLGFALTTLALIIIITKRRFADRSFGGPFVRRAVRSARPGDPSVRPQEPRRPFGTSIIFRSMSLACAAAPVFRAAMCLGHGVCVCVCVSSAKLSPRGGWAARKDTAAIRSFLTNVRRRRRRLLHHYTYH